MNQLLSSIWKIALAIVGYFILFDAYFIILGMAHGTLSMVHAMDLWKRAAYLFWLPFSAIWFDIRFLAIASYAYAILPSAEKQQVHNLGFPGAFSQIFVELIKFSALILIVALAIWRFERKLRSRKTQVFFYFFVPGLLWIVGLHIIPFL